MEIYHRTGIRLVGVGHCGPTTPVDVPADEARKLATWPAWSLTPFTKNDGPPEAQEIKEEAVNNAE